MKSKIILQIFVFQVLLLVALIIVLYELFKVRRIINLEKRISKYTVKKMGKETPSIGDELKTFFMNLTNKIADNLSKSNYFKNRSKHYDKYVHNLKYETNSSYKILAIKMIFAILFCFIYILSATISITFNGLFMILFIIIGYFIYDIYLFTEEKRRNRLIENDLLKAIIIMNNAFKSGYNITQAINMVVKDLKGPISEEFYQIGEDLTYGLELKDVFDRFYNRVQIEDAKYITSSLSLLNLTGGNLTGIFSSIEKSFTNKKRLRNELNAMTSSSNLVYKVLLAMPFLLIMLIMFINPSYFDILFQNVLGYLAIALTLFLIILYIFIIKRILKVDV
jgi:tight adherence protein B